MFKSVSFPLVIISVLLLGVFVVLNTQAATKKYPSRWWTPINDKEVPYWEILPQAAGKGEVILSKRNELGILSNFAPTPFTLDGKRYASMEGFWQMMKYPDSKLISDSRTTFAGLVWKYTRKEVAAMKAFEAKKAGDLASENMNKMGINWVSYEGRKMTYRTSRKGEHYKLIERAIRAKLDQNPEVKKTLLATGNLKLRPDHKQKPDRRPAWEYFNIYMQIRAELQSKTKRRAKK